MRPIIHKERGIVMRKFFACIIMLILLFGLCACQGNTKVRKIKFPKTAQELHDRVPFEFNIGDYKDMMGKNLPLYKIVRRRTPKNEKYYDGCLFKAFAGSINETIKRDRFTKYVCNDGDSLEIYDDGNYVFTSKRSSKETIRTSDQEIILLAEEYLKNNALLPDGFKAGKTLGGTYNADGTPVMKSVGFYHKINGYEIYGRSDITVEIDAYGICAIYSIYSNYEFEKNVRCLSYEEVLDIDPLQEGQILYDPAKLKGKIDSVIINELKIMYYDSPFNQPELNYIQPIYQFKGTAFDGDGNSTDYYWTISAIP